MLSGFSLLFENCFWFVFRRYKDTFNRLRTLKTEIEHLQHLLEKAKVQLMKDFELWWAEQAAQLQVPQNSDSQCLCDEFNSLL